MRNHLFHFKQFSISDQNSLMKIGTDAVLLASSVDSGPATILDIGTGCGIIALILAHKFPDSIIDAIDIHADSCLQAQQNVNRCNKTHRINIRNISFQDYIKQYPFTKNNDQLSTNNYQRTTINEQLSTANFKLQTSNFELIITNPPFFSNSLKSDDKHKNLWRHNDSLSQETLIHGVSRLLAIDGSFYIILPVDESVSFIASALKESIYVNSRIDISPKSNKNTNRVILKMSKTKPLNQNLYSFSIRNSDNSFSDDYIKLTRSLYLNF